MILLSLDPGLSVTGWAVLVDNRLVQSGADRASQADPGKRLERIAENARCLFGDVILARDRKPSVVVAVERATPQTREGRYTDSWGPGVAAGIYLGVVAAEAYDCRILSIPVREWRSAMVGRCHGRDEAKRLAILRAGEELRAVGLAWGGTEATRADEAEAVCLGVYAARRMR